MGALVPSVAVGVIKDLAPPCSLCFPLDPQTIAAIPQMLSRMCLRHLPAPEAHIGTGPHVCGTGRSLALNGSESSSLKPWCAALHRGGLGATFPCWHILLLPPPSPQLPRQGAAGRPWLGRVKGGSSKPPGAVASRSAAALTAVRRHGCAVPLRPCHTHGWSARGASRQSCPSQEQGLSSRGEGALAAPESPAQAGGTGRPVLALGACSTAAQTPLQEHSPA